MSYKKAYLTYKNGVRQLDAAIAQAVRDARRMKKRLSSPFRRAFIANGGFRGWMFCAYQYVDSTHYGEYPDMELRLQRIGSDEMIRIRFRRVRALAVDSALSRRHTRLKDTVIFFHLKKKKKAVACYLLLSSGMRMKINCKKVKMKAL